MDKPAMAAQPPVAEGVKTRPSPFTVDETLERLRQVIAGRNLMLFAHVDHGGEAARVGLEMPETHVLIFGNPKGGTPMMLAAPLLALDLPLKLLVWQDRAQQVWVSTNSAAYLAGRYGLAPELAGNLAVVEAVIEQALSRA